MVVDAEGRMAWVARLAAFAVLVNLEGINQPVRVCECAWIVRAKSVQVAALGAQTLSYCQTLPAQSPQKVVSNTICWFMICASRLQAP